DPPFAGRLLGLRQAEVIPEGAREVKVPPGTVVTPLAREALKRRGIGIRVVSAREVDKASNGGEWGFACEVDSGPTSALRRGLLEGGHWVEVGKLALDAARWVAEGPGRGAIAIANESSVAVWVINQVAGVRGAAVGDADAVTRAVRYLGANLLVIEP